MTLGDNPQLGLQPAGYFISAPWRSSGKTLVSVGLAAAARAQQLAVQTFKKGPDFIDPQWLKLASGEPCYNLDPYLQSTQELQLTYRRHTAHASITIVEGTMGLHDGLATDGSDSNAMIAKLLDIPVILVIDCRGMHRTVAALINGVQQFDPSVAYAGVILNRVRSSRHEGKIQRAIAEYTDLSVLGTLAENNEVQIAEGDLGLLPAAQLEDAERYVDAARKLLVAGCDSDSLFLNRPPPISDSFSSLPEISVNDNREMLTVGIARDAAFHFYYEDDLTALRDRGVELVELSPIDDSFPQNLDGLLIGGGFPERYAEKLAGNTDFREELKQAIESGLPVRAECAGLMYLCRSLIIESCYHPMVGAIAGDVSMHKKPSGRGYVQLEYSPADAPDPYVVPSGATLCAHEFHHSSISFDSTPDFAYRIRRGFGVDGHSDGVRINNVVATYAHFRHTQTTPWVDWFVGQINLRKQARLVQHV